MPLSSISVYTLLDDGKTTAGDGFSTDPQQLTGKYTILTDTKHIFGFQNVAPVVSQKVARGGRAVVREDGERRVGEADAPRDAGDEQGGRDRQEDARGRGVGVPEGERPQVVKVVVLGGGSTGEHFVGALRRLDADVELTLVESRLVGGECSYFACMPTKTMLRSAELSSSLERAPGMHAGAARSGRRLVVARLGDERLGRRRPGRVARGPALRARARVGRVLRPGVRRRRRDGDRVRPARRRHRLGAGDPAGGRARQRRLLDEPRTRRGRTRCRRASPSWAAARSAAELAQFFSRLGAKVTIVERGPRLLGRVHEEAGDARRRACSARRGSTSASASASSASSRASG